MNGAFYISATGLSANEQALEVVANNIANINTTAFKRSEVAFSALVSPADLSADAPSASRYRLASPSGVMVGATPQVFVEGPLQTTGQALDLAIEGDGFIELMGPGGQTMLWRGGSLSTNADGYLAGPGGLPLKGMISVPAGTSAIAIQSDGKVQAQVNGEATATTIGQIDLVRVKDITTLSATNNGLYQVDDPTQLIGAAPGQDGAGVLASGMREGSNVQLADEMTGLLLLQRAYAANAQVVQAGDQLMSIANSLKR
jgi:flagellar basal-body rod protein FlgG